MEPTIAVVGLGAMGLRCAVRLVESGFVVRGFDVREEAREALQDGGGVACSSPGEAVEGAGCALLFVVNAAQAEEVLFGRSGLAHGAARSDLSVVSCVTMGPDQALALHARCRNMGWKFLDAPVSGGIAGAAAGALTIMAAGESETVNACRPVLDAMGRLVVVGGTAGQGSMVKVINQLLCGVHIAAAGEAMALAQRAGLDCDLVFGIVGQSAASSWMLKDRAPRMIARSFDHPTSTVDTFCEGPRIRA